MIKNAPCSGKTSINLMSFLRRASYLYSFIKRSLSWHLAIIRNINGVTKEKIFEERVVLWEILTISSKKCDTLPMPSTKQLYVHFSIL